MERALLQQQRFNITLRTPDGKSEPYNCTKDVDSVTLSLDINMLSVLSFNLRNVDIYAEFLYGEFIVDFEGGYYTDDSYFSSTGVDGQFKYNSSSKGSEHFKKMFSGRIFFMKLLYMENGMKVLNVECREIMWNTVAFERNRYAYPSAKSKRSFAADKDSIKLSEIVEGIAEDLGLRYNSTGDRPTIKIKNDHTYTQRNPAVQNDITDWTFLRKLAKENSCYVWSAIDPNTGDYSLYFIDRGYSRKTDGKGDYGRIEFVWLDRNDSGEFRQGDYLQLGNDTDEFAKLKPNQILVNAISVSYSPQIAGLNVYAITNFDEEDKPVQELVSYDEKNDDLIYWKLDEKKIELLNKTNPVEATKILNMGAFSIPREIFQAYYSRVAIKKGASKAIDEPFHGIDVEMTINGSVNIEPYQSYPIYGIGRWSSRGYNSLLYYYLHSIEHTWGENNFVTVLKFKA